TNPDTKQGRTPVSAGNTTVRLSIDDLLLLNEEESALSIGQQSLPPALLPQSTENTAVGESLAQSNAEEMEEFGDFLQGNSTTQTTQTAIEEETKEGNVTGKKVGGKDGLVGAFGSLSVKHTEDGKLKDEIGERMTDQVLQWISASNTVGAEGNNDVVGDAWENASGLMGGSHMDAHIGEIASRFCSVIPAETDNRKQPEAGEEEEPNVVPVAEETDAWRELLEGGFSTQTNAEEAASRAVFERRVLDSVWPRDDNVWNGDADNQAEDPDGDLVNAYLKLADMSKNE
ncbi:hypothetical protein IWW45_008190, partial [Coemansia sp. RSA 485]